MAAALGVASAPALASGNWDAQYAMLGENGMCEQFNIKLDDKLENCRGHGASKICEYALRIGNVTKGLAQVTITIGSLPNGWQLIMPGQHQSLSLKAWKWETVKLFRSTAGRPPSPALVSVDCALALP